MWFFVTCDNKSAQCCKCKTTFGVYHNNMEVVWTIMHMEHAIVRGTKRCDHCNLWHSVLPETYLCIPPPSLSLSTFPYNLSLFHLFLSLSLSLSLSPVPTHTCCRSCTYSLKEQASQWHEVYCHDLKVMSSNPGRVELGVRSTSVLSCTWTKNVTLWYTFSPYSLSPLPNCWLYLCLFLCLLPNVELMWCIFSWLTLTYINENRVIQNELLAWWTKMYPLLISAIYTMNCC